MKLDKWDLQLIKMFKRSHGTFLEDIDKAKDIWVKRCNTKKEHICLPDIVGRMIEINADSNPIDLFEYIVNSHSSNQWKLDVGAKRLEHWEKAFAIVSSKIRFTEVKRFDGWIN